VSGDQLGNNVRDSARKPMDYNGDDIILTYPGFSRALPLFREMSLVDTTGWRLWLVFRSLLLQGENLDMYSKRLVRVSTSLLCREKHTHLSKMTSARASVSVICQAMSITAALFQCRFCSTLSLRLTQKLGVGGGDKQGPAT
jgi:hypothetical protein